MTIKPYPITTTNKNVPDNVFIIYESNVCGGEIITTTYITGDGSIMQVGDWCTDKPHSISLYEASRLTGDNDDVLYNKALDYFYDNPSL
jgi:hypothetical protein